MSEHKFPCGCVVSFARRSVELLTDYSTGFRRCPEHAGARKEATYPSSHLMAEEIVRLAIPTPAVRAVVEAWREYDAPVHALPMSERWPPLKHALDALAKEVGGGK